MSAEATANAQADMSGRAAATIRSQLHEIYELRHALDDEREARRIAEAELREAHIELQRLRNEATRYTPPSWPG